VQGTPRLVTCATLVCVAHKAPHVWAVGANATRCVHPWCGEKGGGRGADGTRELRVPYKTEQLCVRACARARARARTRDLNICFIYDVPKLCNTESHIKSFRTSLLLFWARTVELSAACPNLAFKSHEI
jgi:hypothetical protein